MKTFTKIVACLSALVLVLVCFASCAKTVKAEEMKLSATEITVKKGEKAYFAVAVDFEDSDAGKTVSEGFGYKSDDEKQSIAKITCLVNGVTEDSTRGAMVEFEGKGESTDEVISNIAVSDNLYFVTADDNAVFTAADLGDDVVKFVTENAKAELVNVYAVDGVSAGTVTLTFTAGDQTATVKITVTE